MKIRSIFLAVMVIIGGGAAARAAPDDVARIRAMEDKLAAAVEARNLDAIMRVYIADE